MGITLYGAANSRTMRVLWMATELDLAFDHQPYEWDDPFLKSSAFLAMNPRGAIPTLVDGNVAMGESLAINLYLLAKYGEGHSIAASSSAEHAHVMEWSLWAQGHVEPWVQADRSLVDVMRAIGSLRESVIHTSLTALERTFEKRPWLIADRFTAADLNVAAVLSPSRAQSLDLEGFPALSGWLSRCYDRPAARAARSLYQPATPHDRTP
jgi:glutathione S-transferase